MKVQNKFSYLGVVVLSVFRPCALVPKSEEVRMRVWGCGSQQVKGGMFPLVWGWVSASSKEVQKACSLVDEKQRDQDSNENISLCHGEEWAVQKAKLIYQVLLLFCKVPFKRTIPFFSKFTLYFLVTFMHVESQLWSASQIIFIIFTAFIVAVVTVFITWPHLFCFFPFQGEVLVVF